MAAGSSGDRSLEATPTWAVALVCAVMVIISVIIEHAIHKLGKWFQRRHKKAMNEALEKIKAELMLLGFISLLLTIGQTPISKICIPAKAGDIMLPCKKTHDVEKEDRDSRRRLLWHQEKVVWHRILAGSTVDYCSKYEDKVPLISQSGIHQLHIFIFVLAVFHVLYSVLTMALGKAKMKKWKTWEAETASLEYQFSNDPSRFRFTHQTSFVKRHVGLSSTPGIRWIVAFFRQFFRSVTKVDYLTMRHGFINAHFSPNSKFDFHKYIKRSLEDDFKVVVGIRLSHPNCDHFAVSTLHVSNIKVCLLAFHYGSWQSSCYYLMFMVHDQNFLAIICNGSTEDPSNYLTYFIIGWYTLVWISFVPLIILLIVGMKLEIVIMEMAHKIQDRTSVVKGAPIIEPSNKFFWFNRPQWILFLIHLTLFENAFQMAHFLWSAYSFGLKSCFHENLAFTVAKVIMGLALQFLCSYITFPLYALVTQMGSHMKKAIFEEQTAKALIRWRRAAKERKKLRGANSDAGYMSGENTPSRGSSPIHLLHKYKSNSVDVESVPSSPRFYHSDNENSVIEAPPFVNHGYSEPRRPITMGRNPDVGNSDFSFGAPQ